MAKNRNKRTMNQFAVLMFRDGSECHYCHERVIIDCSPTGVIDKRAATRDHVIPRSYGGYAMTGNLVLACSECNNKRGDIYEYCDCEFCSDIRARFEEGTFIHCNAYPPNYKEEESDRISNSKRSLGFRQINMGSGSGVADSIS